MQVVEPYPTRWNPRPAREGGRPAASRYRVTTFDPGAKLVLTQGLVRNPRSTAFFARSPAPIMTAGLEVFVQLVMAAITTAPSASRNDWPPCGNGAPPARAAPPPPLFGPASARPPSPTQRPSPS